MLDQPKIVVGIVKVLYAVETGYGKPPRVVEIPVLRETDKLYFTDGRHSATGCRAQIYGDDVRVSETRAGAAKAYLANLEQKAAYARAGLASVEEEVEQAKSLVERSRA